MDNIILVDVVDKLDSEEIDAFKAWLKQKTKKMHQNAILMVDFIVEEQRNNRSVSYADLHLLVYKQSTTQYNKIRAVASSVLKLIEQFLVGNYIQRYENTHFKMNLLSVYGQLELERGWKLQEQQLKRELDKTKQINDNYFFEQYQLSKMIYQNNIFFQRNLKQEVEEMMGHFDMYFMLEQFRVAFFAISNKLEHYQSKLPMLKTMMKRVRNGVYKDVVIIQAYYYGILCYTDSEQSKNYFKLKAIMERNDEQIAVKDARALILTALNFAIRAYNKGKSEYMQEIFSIYQIGLQNASLLNEKGQISRWTFQNIVSAGLIVDEIDWTEQFLHDYKNKISVADSTSIYQYNLSKLYYKKKAFDVAVLYLQNIDSKDVVEVLNARALLLRIYFEEGEWEALDGLFGSFEQYIRRQKRLGYQKKLYLNLIRFTNRLVRIRNGNKLQIENYIKRLKSQTVIADKPWLLMQANSILDDFA